MLREESDIFIATTCLLRKPQRRVKERTKSRKCTWKIPPSILFQAYCRWQQQHISCLIALEIYTRPEVIKQVTNNMLALKLLE